MGFAALIGAVVGIQIHLLHFAHQGIPGIGTGALVVEGLFYHVVQPCQEVGFVDAVVPDGFLDANLFLQIIQGGQQILQLFFVGLTAQSQVVSHFRVPLQSVGVVILGISTALKRSTSLISRALATPWGR